MTDPTRADPVIDGLTVYEGAARFTDVAAWVATATPDLISFRKYVTLEKIDGLPKSHSLIPQLVTPITTSTSLTIVVSGPPESPLQAPAYILSDLMY
jgi:hypothetical protein